MANILLIEPSVAAERYLVNKDLNPHGGLLQLGTILKQAGHKVKILHWLSDGLPQTLGFHLAGVDVVGITFTTFQLKVAKALAKQVKELKPNVMVVAGGAHVSATNGLQNYFDVLIKGEADKTFLDVIEGKIQHDHYVQGEPIEDLDKIPLPDLSLVDIRKFAGLYPPGPLPQLNVQASRGCPSQCAFCSCSVFGKRVRFRSIESVIEQIEKAYVDYGIKEVFFQDDTFNVNREYCVNLIEAILKSQLHKHILFRARLRANEKLVDAELLKLMKRANFWLIFYGCESGSQSMLDKMCKRLTVDEIKRAFALTKEAGIKVEGSFIIGMPGETELTINQSIQLYRDLKPDWCSFNRAIPFPGTSFEHEVRAKGHLLYPDYEQWELNKTLVRTDELSAEQLERWAMTCDNLILKTKMKRILSHPTEAMRILKDSGLKGVGKKIVSLAK